MSTEKSYTAFAGVRLLFSGPLEAMLLSAKAYVDGDVGAQLLVFEDQSGKQIDFDLRGTPQEVLARLGTHPHFASAPEKSKPQQGPGRPKLGVVSREVSLLPRHWEWLERQPGGSSGALRRLVDEARKQEPQKEDIIALRDATGRFMSVMGGDLPNFEEATRALYAGNHEKVIALIQQWPVDIREHAGRLMARCARS